MTKHTCGIDWADGEEPTLLSSLLYTEASEECEKATFKDLDAEDPEEKEAVAAIEKAKK